jgi:hypothetical protein
MAAIIDSSGRLLTASPLSADQKAWLHILTFLVNIGEPAPASPTSSRARSPAWPRP